jgi:hypothetical protein
MSDSAPESHGPGVSPNPPALAAPLTNDERLTLLAHALQSVLVTNDRELTTLWDRLLDVGVPVNELLADAPPLSAPPYSRQTFERLRRWPDV